jgi:hypothetical protein
VTKVVTFKDYETYSRVHEENIVVTAAQQLEDFLNDNFYGKVSNINYSVTLNGFNGAGLPIYRNHILLVYEGLDND